MDYAEAKCVLEIPKIVEIKKKNRRRTSNNDNE
jgi:hypothetical protein